MSDDINEELIEEVAMTMNELLEQFFDPELEQLICAHMQGKPVMKAYVTLCYIIGASIARTSSVSREAQHAMNMCAAVVAAICTATHNTDVKKKEAQDEGATNTTTTRLQ